MKKLIVTTMVASSCLFMFSAAAAPAPVDPATTVATPAAVATTAAKAEPSWYWLSSDQKYSKFYDRDSVHVTAEANTAEGKVPTEIQGVIKTGYTTEGAAETIKNYGISNIIPNPQQLSYSIATVSVNPQERTMCYLNEVFYDKNGVILWKKGEAREKEINSQEFDEEFYVVLIDKIFRHGEQKRSKDAERWISLWTSKASDGSGTTVTGDTSTMRLRGNNLILWEWSEHRDKAGNVQEVKFYKVTVDLDKGAEKVLKSKVWTAQTGWQTINVGANDPYRVIREGSPEMKSINRLRAFAAGYGLWVNRYSLNPVVYKNPNAPAPAAPAVPKAAPVPAEADEEAADESVAAAPAATAEEADEPALDKTATSKADDEMAAAPAATAEEADEPAAAPVDED